MTVRYTEGNRRRVTTPSFPDCKIMDDFYAEAHRVIEKQFASIAKGSPRLVCVADCSVTEENGDVCVTLRLRIRENGRVVSKKNAVHRWRDGYIAPPERRIFPFTIISKYREKHKRKV